MNDAGIWAQIVEMTEATGWPPSAVIDALAEKLGLPSERIRQVWRERAVMGGAG